MVEEVNLAEDRKKKLRKILKTAPAERSDEDIKLIEALVEVSTAAESVGQQVLEAVQGDG